MLIDTRDMKDEYYYILESKNGRMVSVTKIESDGDSVTQIRNIYKMDPEKHENRLTPIILEEAMYCIAKKNPAAFKDLKEKIGPFYWLWTKVAIRIKEEYR